MTAWYVDTLNPVAFESYDHRYPQIDGEDLSFNVRFNARLYQIVPPPLTLLDVGCGGGSFVKTVLDDGNEAVGLDGTSHYRDLRLFAWPVIPEHLFTCDTTFPFTVHTGDHQPYPFDVATAWEFLEHIQEHDLPSVLRNIHDHLKDGGLFFISTPGDHRRFPRKGLDHHRTHRPGEWWLEQITSVGFENRPDVQSFIGSQGYNWVRTSRVRHVYRKV